MQTLGNILVIKVYFSNCKIKNAYMKVMKANNTEQEICYLLFYSVLPSIRHKYLLGSEEDCQNAAKIHFVRSLRV